MIWTLVTSSTNSKGEQGWQKYHLIANSLTEAIGKAQKFLEPNFRFSLSNIL